MIFGKSFQLLAFVKRDVTVATSATELKSVEMGLLRDCGKTKYSRNM